MDQRNYLTIIAMAVFLSSCLKQSIPDAMRGITKQSKITATLNYEINGEPVSISVDDADHQGPGVHKLECVKSNGYILSAVGSFGELIFTFLTDSLTVGDYSYPANWGQTFVTGSQEGPVYVYYPTDNMNFTVTQHKDAHFSGTFSGQLTPMPDNRPGDPGSVIIRNGSFNNIPIVY